MKTLLTVFLILALVAVAVVLLMGVVGMLRGGDPQRSNKLMRWRVGLQAVALAIVALLMLMLKSMD
ncbi:MAG: twin transmembrane helix small protein [Rhodospirillales bacterium]|nr:twin transmembrane helix small protein [Rhodospirillales bacterium]